VEIVRAGAERIPDLQPLWESLSRALVHMRGPEETWATGDRVAELDTLAVLPGHRGQGIGSALVDRVQDELRRLGVGHIAVSVIASNADAVRFYERLGLTRFLITFAGAVPD
jgi:ribosomal protein S18 acetylase RimI-like enzyme